MRKWLLIIGIVLAAAVAGIYIFIPSRLHIIQRTPIQCTTTGAYRTLANTTKWKDWWPDSTDAAHIPLFAQSKFAITDILNNTIAVRIDYEGASIISSLHILPTGVDSTTLRWECSLATSNNPILRVQRYLYALVLKKELAALSNHFKAFAEKKENIYGITFQQAVYKDSLLISIKSNLSDYPTQRFVNNVILALKMYGEIFQAKQTGHPILNITPLEPGGFQVMIAVPVDKAVPADKTFFMQRIPLNQFLVSRVQGGAEKVNEALHQIQLYIQDYRKTVMALPFQQLVTDRSLEPDSTRWVTDIYVPVF